MIELKLTEDIVDSTYLEEVGIRLDDGKIQLTKKNSRTRSLITAIINKSTDEIKSTCTPNSGNFRGDQFSWMIDLYHFVGLILQTLALVTLCTVQSGLFRGFNFYG